MSAEVSPSNYVCGLWLEGFAARPDPQHRALSFNVFLFISFRLDINVSLIVQLSFPFQTQRAIVCNSSCLS